MPTDESVNMLKRTFNLNKKYIISTVMPILGVTSVCVWGGGGRRKTEMAAAVSRDMGQFS